ncbi:glycosyltransferase [Rhodococcus aetherivorans]
MRILQVVTLLSPDGAYGGPARVALDQSRELRCRGHDVTLAAATRGFPVVPTEVNDVPVQLFPARTLLPGSGFAGLGAPGLGRWFRRCRADFDLVHVHLGRDLVTLPVAVTALRHRIPYAVQTHGMVVPSRHPLATPLDAIWTRKVLLSAGAVFHLTPREREQLIAVAGPDLALEQLRNGVPDLPVRAPTASGPPEVLFAARLHPRKRPTVFVEMARALLATGADARFTLIGPDQGEGSAVLAAIGNESRIRWSGPVDPAQMRRRVACATVYVLPSVREPYPMGVLEAMSVGVPVIVGTDCGLAPLVERTGSGIVTAPDVPALTAAVRTLLVDRTLATDMGERARATVRRELGMAPVCRHLEDTYSRLIGWKA